MSTRRDRAAWDAMLTFDTQEDRLQVMAGADEPRVHLLLGEFDGEGSRSDSIVCDLSVDQARAVGRCLVDLASWLGDDAPAQGG